MAKIGKISPIKKKYDNSHKSVESALAVHGYVRFPGTTETFLPYKDASGKYRTGLDPDAQYLYNLEKEAREVEQRRIKDDLAFIARATNGLDVSPNSPYWNYGSKEHIKINPVKIGNEDMFFNLEDVWELLQWNFMRVNPRIAPSYQAWENGDVPPQTKYYVADDNIETKITFNKKQEINKAIAKLESLTPTRRKQVARLMGLPITDDAPEEIVYNEIDTALKSDTFKEGSNKGRSTVALFNDLVSLQTERLDVKDLVEQAISHNIIRTRNGDKLYEGELKVADSKLEYIDFLLDDGNQQDLIALEKKLKQKKI